jgi:hypothetical protein
MSIFEDRKQKLILAKVLYNMHEYQKMNGIHKECVTNSLFLYDCLDLMATAYGTLKPKLCTGVCVYTRDINLVMNIHCWVQYDGKNLEPSYDVYSTAPSDRDYVDNVKELFSEYGELISSAQKREFIKGILGFRKMLDDAIKNTKMTPEGYRAQQKYIIESMPELLPYFTKPRP